MLVGRTGTLYCPGCGMECRQYVDFDELEKGIKCGICFAIMELKDTNNNRSQVLHGQYSDDINSELYLRPDKPNMGPDGDRARSWKKSYKIIEGLIAQGKTKPFSKAELKMVNDRQANYEKECGKAP